MEEYLAIIGNNSSSNDRKTVSTRGDTGWKNTSWGNVIIPSTSKRICVWTIKINSGDTNNMGVSSGQAVANVACFRRKTDYNYAYSSLNGKSFSQWMFKSYGEPFRQGDIVKIKLDLVEREVSFYKNNVHQGIAFTNIACGVNINYRLAVSQGYAGDSVTLLGLYMYQCANIAEIKEEKDSVESMNARINKLQHLYKKQQDINTNSLQLISHLESDNKQKTSQNAKFIEVIAQLKKEHECVKNKLSSLEDERKEFEMKISELKEENKQLKLQNINTDNYEKWSGDEIVHWIISLNPQVYGQYQQILATLLKEEDVNGECLNDVDISDIKRWGVKNFKHSKQLLKEIKSLIENKKEGTNPSTVYI